MPRCVIPGCHRRNTSTHFFPKDTDRRTQWVDFVKQTNPDFVSPGQYSCICGAHFETQCFNFSLWLDKNDKNIGSKNPRRTLSEDAVPTLVGNEVTTTVAEFLQMSTPSVYSMIQSLPSPGTERQSSGTTNTQSAVSRQTGTGGEKNTKDQDYTVMKNESGQKVCFVRTHVNKTSHQPFVQSIARDRSATTMTTSTTKSGPSIVKISSTATGKDQRVIMLQDGAPIKVVKRMTVPNVTQATASNHNRYPEVVRPTILPKQPASVKDSPITRTVLSSVMPSYKTPVPQLSGKKLFTVDELDRLPKDGLIDLFTTKVQILDSANFALRCQLIKSCPFIISCPSKSDCLDVMHLHLKKHITTLRSKQASNRAPYQIPTGIRLNSDAVGLKTFGSSMVPQKRALLSKPGPRAPVPVSHISQNGNILKLAPLTLPKSSKMLKVVTPGRIQGSSSATTNLVSAVPKVFPPRVSVPSTSIVNSTGKMSFVLNPVNLKMPTNNAANNQKMVMQVGKQIKVVPSGSNKTQSQNMTYVIMPLPKAGHNAKSTASSEPKTPTVYKYENRPNLPKILLRTQADRDRTCYRKASDGTLTRVTKAGGSPLTITNEVILKAKALLDQKSVRPQAVDICEREANSPPPFEFKITPPRLSDLAKHVVKTSTVYTASVDVEKLLSILEAQTHRTNDPSDKINLFNNDIATSSLGLVKRRKNAFLSMLKLERVGHRQANTVRRQRDLRTRFQRRKLREQILKNSLKKTVECEDPGISECFAEQVSKKRSSLNKTVKFEYPGISENVTEQVSKKCSSLNKTVKFEYPGISENVTGQVSKKRSSRSLLWWREPDSKMLKRDVSNTKNEVKFKQTRKPQSFCYGFYKKPEKKSKSSASTKPLTEILPTGLIVLKRCGTSLPDRTNALNYPKKYQEITVNGRVVRIKQEPMSVDEYDSNVRNLHEPDDKLLEPPSDDEMDDLLWDKDKSSDVDSTDSENECNVEQKTHDLDQTTSHSKTSEEEQSQVNEETLIEPDNESFKEADIPYLAIKYIDRLNEVIRVRNSILEPGQDWPLPAVHKTCTICCMEFDDIDSLLAHYTRHAGPLFDELKYTDMKAPEAKASPKSHLKKTGRKRPAKSSKKTIVNDPGFDQPYECELCHMRFYALQFYEEHLIEKHSYSAKAMGQVLLYQSQHQKHIINQSVTNTSDELDVAVWKVMEKENAKTQRSLNDFLNNFCQLPASSTSDSLECHSPPLPSSPGSKAALGHCANSTEIEVKSVYVKDSGSDTALMPQSRASDMRPIKLTLFPRHGSGLVRMCPTNNGKVA